MIELQVDDMTCGHCAGRITQAVKAADASARLEIALPQYRVRISSILGPDKIVQLIRDAGYTPETVNVA